MSEDTPPEVQENPRLLERAGGDKQDSRCLMYSVKLPACYHCAHPGKKQKCMYVGVREIGEQQVIKKREPTAFEAGRPSTPRQKAAFKARVVRERKPKVEKGEKTRAKDTKGKKKKKESSSDNSDSSSSDSDTTSSSSEEEEKKEKTEPVPWKFEEYAPSSDSDFDLEPAARGADYDASHALEQFKSRVNLQRLQELDREIDKRQKRRGNVLDKFGKAGFRQRLLLESFDCDEESFAVFELGLSNAEQLISKGPLNLDALVIGSFSDCEVQAWDGKSSYKIWFSKKDEQHDILPFTHYLNVGSIGPGGTTGNSLVIDFAKDIKKCKISIGYWTMIKITLPWEVGFPVDSVFQLREATERGKEWTLIITANLFGGRDLADCIFTLSAYYGLVMDIGSMTDDEAQHSIRDALSVMRRKEAANGDVVLCSLGNEKILRKDKTRLELNDWLSDSLVNTVLFVHELKYHQLMSFRILHSDIYQLLKHNPQRAASHKLIGFDFHKTKTIFLPFVEGGHWFVCVLKNLKEFSSGKEKQFTMYFMDSLNMRITGPSFTPIIQKITVFVHMRLDFEKEVTSPDLPLSFEHVNWQESVAVKKIVGPRQRNSYDCALHTIEMIKRLSWAPDMLDEATITLGLDWFNESDIWGGKMNLVSQLRFASQTGTMPHVYSTVDVIHGELRPTILPKYEPDIRVREMGPVARFTLAMREGINKGHVAPILHCPARVRRWMQKLPIAKAPRTRVNSTSTGTTTRLQMYTDFRWMRRFANISAARANKVKEKKDKVAEWLRKKFNVQMYELNPRARGKAPNTAHVIDVDEESEDDKSHRQPPRNQQRLPPRHTVMRRSDIPIPRSANDHPRNMPPSAPVTRTAPNAPNSHAPPRLNPPARGVVPPNRTLPGRPVAPGVPGQRRPDSVPARPS